MTKQWYKDNGYELSQLIEQNVIDRAEREVKEAYIAPIVGEVSPEDERVKRAIANLAFLLILQRTIFATRAGAKVKVGYNSADADAWEKLSQQATICHMSLDILRNVEGAKKDAEVLDICKIYFKTNFICL